MKQDTKVRIILALFMAGLGIFMIFISYQMNDSELFQRTAVDVGSVATYPVKLICALFFIMGLMCFPMASKILFEDVIEKYENDIEIEGDEI